MRFYGKKILLSWIFIKTQNNIAEKLSDHKKIYPASIEFLERSQLRIQDVKLLEKNNKKHAFALTFIVGVPNKRLTSSLFFHNKNKVPD